MTNSLSVKVRLWSCNYTKERTVTSIFLVAKCFRTAFVLNTHHCTKGIVRMSNMTKSALSLKQFSATCIKSIFNDDFTAKTTHTKNFKEPKSIGLPFAKRGLHRKSFTVNWAKMLQNVSSTEYLWMAASDPIISKRKIRSTQVVSQMLSLSHLCYLLPLFTNVLSMQLFNLNPVKTFTFFIRLQYVHFPSIVSHCTIQLQYLKWSKLSTV